MLVESAQDMHAVGNRLGAILQPGDLVILSGPLGAGKTTLVQGIAAGMGVKERVTSPTFVIARVHQGAQHKLIHVDAYRMSSADELDDLGIDEELEDCVTVVEWGRGITEHWEGTPLFITIERDDDSDARTLSWDAEAPAWTERNSLLSEAL